ncbi:MAG TPA: phosphotransferase family protein [Aliidongia sp.]|uniref:phosphotransferase family protein n=1 Tax=Aliidongia sp. TaxID=1914230 RepID=UPI002DDD4E95|nr:phosphotransferase family protein [Aliidongia sp.]HEV2677375.1 phosphotransferase family protein [Aliidongia sp.]
MSSGAEVTEVRAGHAFDTARLAEYLTQHLEGFSGAVRARQFRGGQSNPTFLIETEQGRYVLRKKPPGQLLPSAHMIEREYRVMHALRDSLVPIIGTKLLCEDPSVIGTAFYLMDFAEGRVFRDPALPDMTAGERRAIYGAMSDVMARLHAVDWRAVGLEGFGKPTGYLTRQIALWTRQYEAAKTQEIPAMDALIRWLPAHMPADEATTIAHGDFRLENLMFHPTEPRVLGVLDWELATIGHPFADVAYNCMIWHLDPATPSLGGLKGRDLAALGIPSEADYLADYARSAGRARIENYPFFLAFAFFRFASIAQGVYARALAGNASAPNALEVGSLAGPLADLGWQAAQG